MGLPVSWKVTAELFPVHKDDFQNVSLSTKYRHFSLELEPEHS